MVGVAPTRSRGPVRALSGSHLPDPMGFGVLLQVGVPLPRRRRLVSIQSLNLQRYRDEAKKEFDPGFCVELPVVPGELGPGRQLGERTNFSRSTRAASKTPPRCRAPHQARTPGGFLGDAPRSEGPGSSWSTDHPGPDRDDQSRQERPALDDADPLSCPQILRPRIARLAGRSGFFGTRTFLNPTRTAPRDPHHSSRSWRRPCDAATSAPCDRRSGSCDTAHHQCFPGACCSPSSRL